MRIRPFYALYILMRCTIKMILLWCVMWLVILVSAVSGMAGSHRQLYDVASTTLGWIWRWIAMVIELGIEIEC